jgi:Fic family protein
MKKSDLLISSLLARREALQSSRMKGTWSTIDAVLTPTEVWSDADRKSTHASVYGYAHALEKHFVQCSKNGVAPLNLSLVKSLHREIMQKDPEFRGVPGRIRQPDDLSSVVFIGVRFRKEDSIYNPTTPDRVEQSLNEVMDEMGDARMGLSLALRMAVGHTPFEAVHPFGDGNGRVGRMLMTLQMACSKALLLYLSGYIEKENYYSALMQAQKKLKYEPIVKFIAHAIVESYEEFGASKKALIELPGEWQKRGQFRDQSASKRAINWMVGHPIFAAEEIIELLARPFKEDPKIALARAKLKLDPMQNKF